MSSIPPPETTVPPSAPEPSPPGDEQLRLPLWTAPAAVALGLVLGQVVIVIVDILAQAGGSSLTHPPPAVNIIGNALFDLAFVGAALYFVQLRGRPRAADFGFRRVPIGLAIGAFVLAGLSYYAITIAYAAILNLHGSEKLPKELGVDKSTAAAVAVTVFVCVIAPIAEEFFFRGFFFGVLRRWRIVVAGRNVGTWVAAVVTGILFGLAHTGSASPKYLIPLGILGFILCLVRWRTGSLYPCMALHSVNNSLAIGVNQFHWGLAEIVALIAGSILVIAAITGPLAAPPTLRARA
jgi:membrane protease YdiL (CAAX protease family)